MFTPPFRMVGLQYLSNGQFEHGNHSRDKIHHCSIPQVNMHVRCCGQLKAVKLFQRHGDGVVEQLQGEIGIENNNAARQRLGAALSHVTFVWKRVCLNPEEKWSTARDSRAADFEVSASAYIWACYVVLRTQISARNI